MAYASNEPTAAQYLWEQCLENASDEVWIKARELRGGPLPDCFKPNEELVQARAQELFDLAMDEVL